MKNTPATRTRARALNLARAHRAFCWLSFLAAFAAMLALLGVMTGLHAAGTLTPAGSTGAPIQIRDHQVNVTINNGFARTEVLQTFFNPNAADLEAVYAFPVPKSASLSEVTIQAGEKTLHGEVIPRTGAETIYNEEKSSGNDAAQGTRAQTAATRYQIDANQPACPAPASHVSRSGGSGDGGGGALESTDIAFLLFFAFLAGAAWLGRRAMNPKSHE
jgi:hypothetical protein